MRKRFALLTLSICFSPSLVLAQQEGERRQERPGQAGRPEGRRERPNQPGLPGQNPEMMARGMAMMLRNLPIMKALDVDEDGQLSASEIENASKSLLKLDKNGDGILNADELRPEPGAMPMFAGGGGPGGPGGPGGGGAGGPGGPGAGGPAMMLRMLETRDTNKDGKLSGDEIPEQMRPRLSMIDENGDGSIDKAEIERMTARMQGPGRGPNSRRERDGGGEGVQPKRPPSGNEDPGKK